MSDDKRIKIRILRPRSANPYLLLQCRGKAGDRRPHPEDLRAVQILSLCDEGIDPVLQLAFGVAVGGH